MIDRKLITAALDGLTPRLDDDKENRVLNHVHGIIAGFGTIAGQIDPATAKRELAAYEKKEAFNSSLTQQRLAVLNAEIAHLEAANSATVLGNLALRPQNISVRSPGLRCHEIYDQLRGDLAPMLSNLGDIIERPATFPLALPIQKISPAHKFDLRRLRQKDIGPNADFARELRNKALFRPPFALCWYEWEITTGATIGVLHQWSDDLEKLEWWARIEQNGWARWRSRATREGERFFDSAIRRVVDAAIVILLSRCGEQHLVAAPERINHHRAKAGRAPIFSHTIVEVRALHIDRNGKETLIRRSPRQHWRRGHMRTLRDGNGFVRREIPIAPVLVGSLRHGKISHDYIVAEPNLLTPPRAAPAQRSLAAPLDGSH